jgi:AsmA protein
MRIVKLILSILAGFVAIVVIALIALVMFFDPNRYKPEIEQIVQEKTHRQLTLAGDLKLSVFPWIAIQMGPAQLAEREGFGTQPFVSLQRARLSLRVMPLLKGKIEVGSIELDEPSIRLITNERGQHNWSDLSKQESTTPATPEAVAEPSKIQLQLAGITIRNGALVMEDRKANTRQAIQQFSLSSGAIASNQPFDLKMNFVLEQQGSAPLPVELKSVVTADFDNAKHQLAPLDMKVQWQGSGKKAMPLSLHADQLSLDLNQQRLKVTGLALQADQLKVTGEVAGKEIFDAAQFSGTLALAPVALRSTLKNLDIELPVTRDAQVLKQLSFNSSFNATTTSLALKPIQMKLDDTTLKGELAIVDFASSALRFDLNIDRIDFDRYLPPTEEKAAATESKPAAPPTVIPVDALRDLNIRGALRVDEALFSGLHLNKLHLGVNARDGELKLAPTDASFYGGQYKGAVTLNVVRTPTMSIESHAANIDFAPLFKDLFDSQSIAGRGDFNLKTTAVGKDTDIMLRALNGTLDFQVRDGAYQGIDLLYEIKRARSLFRKEPIAERTGAAQGKPERTEFSTCKGSGVITNGVLSNKDLEMAMQYLSVTGQGTAHLVDDKVDYRLIATVLRMPKEGEDASADLVDAKIPITVTGALSDPKIRPDIEGLVKEEVKKKVDEKKEELKEKAREKLQNKLRDLLGG